VDFRRKVGSFWWGLGGKYEIFDGFEEEIR
jgi:hypothetical protein